MLTRSYKAITARPIVMLAVLLAAGLLFLMQGGLLQAQDSNQKSVVYAENGMDLVLTLVASDPESVTPIVWSILNDATGDQDLGIVQVPEVVDDVADTVDIADRATLRHQ